jgi:hypothetical protein
LERSSIDKELFGNLGGGSVIGKFLGGFSGCQVHVEGRECVSEIEPKMKLTTLKNSLLKIMNKLKKQPKINQILFYFKAK